MAKAVKPLKQTTERTRTIVVDYLRPAPDNDLIAESEVQRVGNRVGMVHSRVYAANDRRTVIAEGRGVYNFRRVRS